MRQKSGTRESSSERLVKHIRRVTRKQYSSEEKIRIVLEGLRGECSIAERCRREGIAAGLDEQDVGVVKLEQLVHRSQCDVVDLLKVQRRVDFGQHALEDIELGRLAR